MCARAHACEKVVRMCVGECVCVAFVNESVREGEDGKQCTSVGLWGFV